MYITIKIENAIKDKIIGYSPFEKIIPILNPIINRIMNIVIRNRIK